MTGTIQGGRLAEVLRGLITSKTSGLLFVKNGPLEKGLYFAAGAVVNAESNVPEEGLGYQLLDAGRLSPQELETALRQVEPGRTLGEVLVASDKLAPAELESMLKTLAAQIVVSVFDWTEGSYDFQEGDFSFRGGFDLRTPSLMLEGVRRMFDFDDTKAALLANTRPLRPMVAGRGPLALEPTEGFIFSRVDGTLSAADICALSIISEEMTCRVLYGLLIAGIISQDGAKEAVPPRGSDARERTGPQAQPTPSNPPRSQPPRPAPPRVEPGPTAASSAPARPSGAGTTTGPNPRVERWTPPSEPASGTQAGTPPRRAGEATGPVQPPSPRVGGGTGQHPRPDMGSTGARPRPPTGMGQLQPWQQERVKEIESLYASLDSLNHYAVLGLGRDATTPAIEDAFQRLVDKYHPAKNPWLTDDALRQRLAFLLAKLKAAHQVLVTHHARIEYDEQLRRHDKEVGADVNVRMEFAKTQRQIAIEVRMKEGETLYREASKLHEAQRHHDARTRILKAIDIYPEEAKYYALAARIEMLNPNLRWQKDAENHIRKAIELDRWNPDYRVLLGLLYKHAGLKTKAKREFIAALEIDPANETALPEVPVAERPRIRTPETGPPPGSDEPEVDWS